MSTTHAVGSLVRARGREWVVLPGTTPDFLLLQPLGGGSADVAGVFPDEGVEAATFPTPTVDDLGDSTSTALLRTALRVGFTASAGPFRSLAGISVSPRSYQYVPLLMALRQDVVRLLIADDVGIGKTIEAGLIAAELLAQGSVQRMAVLCSPALAEQWQRELRAKFGIDAVLLLTSTVKGLERGLMMNESLFDRYPHVIVSTDFIKSDRRRHEFLLRCPELVIVDEAHNSVAGSGIGQKGRHQRYELLRDLAADQSRHLDPRHRHPALRRRGGLLQPRRPPPPRPGHRRPVQRAAAASCSPGTSSSAAAATSAATSTRTPPSPATGSPSTSPTASPRPTATSSTTSSPTPATRSSTDAGSAKGRVRWWSVLALLRALASSPRAAEATLRTRAANSEATTVAEADASAAPPSSTRATRSRWRAWTPRPAPWSTTDDGDRRRDRSASERRRLLDFARRAAQLHGPDQDRKLGSLTQQVKKLLAGGDNPIVFCRFIDTAHYVAEHLVRDAGHQEGPSHGHQRHRRAAACRARASRRRPHRHRRHARPGRHRLPVRGRQPPGGLLRRRPLRPVLEPDPARAARGPRRPLSSSARTSSAPSRSTARTTASTASSSTSSSAATAPSPRPPASPCPSPATARASSTRSPRACCCAGPPATSSCSTSTSDTTRPPTLERPGSRRPRRRRPPAPGSPRTPSSPRRSPPGRGRPRRPRIARRPGAVPHRVAELARLHGHPARTTGSPPSPPPCPSAPAPASRRVCATRCRSTPIRRPTAATPSSPAPTPPCKHWPATCSRAPWTPRWRRTSDPPAAPASCSPTPSAPAPPCCSSGSGST